MKDKGNFCFMQGEAFVPESIVRIGARDSGRAGVLTYEVHDKRVKYEYGVINCHDPF